MSWRTYSFWTKFNFITLYLPTELNWTWSIIVLRRLMNYRFGLWNDRKLENRNSKIPKYCNGNNENRELSQSIYNTIMYRKKKKNIIFSNRTQFFRGTWGLTVHHKRLTLFRFVCRMDTKRKIQITEHTTPRSLISDTGSKSRSLIF